MSHTNPITPEMTIEAVLSNWPQAAALFKQHRLACVGCSLTSFCTLREMSGLYEIIEEEFIAGLDKMIRHHGVEK